MIIVLWNMKIFFLKSSLLKSSGYDLCNDKFIQPLLSGNLNIYPVINSNFDFHDSLYSLINEIDKLCDKRPYAYQLAVKSYLFSDFLPSDIQLWAK